MDEELPVLPKGWIAMREDAVRRLEWKAERDFLTGLYNKGTFQTKACEQLDKAAHEYTLILIDLDDFKQVNDRFGHLEGDNALRRVADALVENFGQIGYVGRIGGDEFAVLLTRPPKEKDLAAQMEHFFVYVTEHTPKEHDFQMTLSAGAASFPDDATSYAGLFGAADLALYEVKNTGKNNFLFCRHIS